MIYFYLFKNKICHSIDMRTHSFDYCDDHLSISFNKFKSTNFCNFFHSDFVGLFILMFLVWCMFYLCSTVSSWLLALQGKSCRLPFDSRNSHGLFSQTSSTLIFRLRSLCLYFFTFGDMKTYEYIFSNK